MWCRSTRRCSFLCVFFLWWSILSKPFRVTNLFSLSKVVHLSIAWLEGIYKAHKVKTGPAMLTYKNSWKQWYIRAHTFISKVWYIWNELWADVGVCIFNKSRNDISFLKNLFIEVLADLQCVNFCRLLITLLCAHAHEWCNEMLIRPSFCDGIKRTLGTRTSSLLAVNVLYENLSL